MYGLIAFGILGIYLVLLIWATRFGYRFSEKIGWVGKKRWLGAALAFLIVYLPVFWDWIPTVVTHKYYCATEAGFWVYKSLDQWKAENPGVLNTLLEYKGKPPARKGDMLNYVDTYYLNERFNWVIKHNGKLLFNRWRHEQEVVDLKNNTVMARYVDFSTSQEVQQAGWSGWKFWIEKRHCTDGEYKQDELRNYRNNFMGENK